MRFLIVAAVAACSAGAGPAAEAPAPRARVVDGFWEHWGDGRAELDGYRLGTPRYGAPREGEIVLIFVTEDLTHGQRVKSDGGHDDAYPVLKLNEVRDFQTGIYDYNGMTSTFLRLDGEGALGVPVKVSSSLQEWCGHVYEQLVPGDGALAWTSHSYFDGEADREASLPLPAGAVLGDALPLVVRGLAGDLVAPGERAEVPYLPTLLDGRLQHRAPAWTSATIERAPAPEEVTVPAGTFSAHRVTVRPDGWPETTWWVEEAWPHRLVRWTRSNGEVAELTGSLRAPYWEQKREGDEALRAKLGLPPPR